MPSTETSSPADAGLASSLPSLEALGNISAAASQVRERDRSTHGHRWKVRRAVIDALDRRSLHRAPDESPEDTDRLDRRSFNLAKCNCFPKIWVTPSGLPRVIWGQCRDRLCPRCSFYRSKRLAFDIHERVASLDSLRFLTLTLASDGLPLRDRLDRLYQAWRDLRRRKDWKAHVRGGVATIEVTLNQETGNWNCHLHVIIDGTYFDQKLISEIWLSVTGDSPIVFIKPVFDRKDTGNYIAKYVAKLSSVVGWPRTCVREFALAMCGRRLVMTFGSTHGSDIDLSLSPEREGCESSIADCNRIIELAHDGNVHALRAIAIARVLGPTFAGSFGVLAEPGWLGRPPPPAGVYEEFVFELRAAVHVKPFVMPQFLRWDPLGNQYIIEDSADEGMGQTLA